MHRTAAVIVLALTGCSGFTQTAGAVEGPDVAKNQVFVVTTSAKHPSTLIVKVSGEIDGTADITTHDGRVTSIGPGVVDKVIGGDYYNATASILYSPGTAKSGKLVIRYSFN